MSAQGIAQDYWLALMAQPLLAASALSDLLEIVDDFAPGERDEANAAIQQYYLNSGRAVDLDTLRDVLHTLQSSKLAFWAGTYRIPHPDGSALHLNIGGDTVTLDSTDALKAPYFSVPTASVRFEDQTLSYEDDSVRFSARFWYPAELPENAGVAPAVMATRNEARLTGTLSVVGDAPEGPYALTGKRGVFTAAGFADPGYGDPAAVWAGRYQAQYVDGDFSFPGAITLSVDADGAMALALGDLQAAAVAFANNTLVAKLPTGAILALRLVCTPSGVRSFTGAVETRGITRRLAGTCPVPYAESTARPTLRAASDSAAPAFCDTRIDQVLTLAQLGTPVEPLKSLHPVPVVYADGSPGSIVITPSRAADVYRVPPGRMVAYRPPTARHADDELQVAWKLDEGYTLLTMIEAAYYQVRVTLSDAQGADREGIEIAMALDAVAAPGFLSLMPPSASTCGDDTGGAESPVQDFRIASVLVANTREADANRTLAYRFALSGKSSSPDNAARDHDGFLCATLRYNAADGSEKYPSRSVRVPLLCAVTLPVTLAAPLTIEGMSALPTGYPNRPYSATVSATGGLPPVVWSATSPAPEGLAWAPADDGSSFTLSGTLGAVPTGVPIPVSVSAQSDPGIVVSSVKTGHGMLPVSDPPPAPPNYQRIGWITGSVLFCGGALAAFLIGRKLLSRERAPQEQEINEMQDMAAAGDAQVRDLGQGPIRGAGHSIEEEILEASNEDLARIREDIARREGLIGALQARYDVLMDRYVNDGDNHPELADEMAAELRTVLDSLLRNRAELTDVRNQEAVTRDAANRV